MSSGMLLGLDAGTSAVKAAAFDARNGRVLASATRTIAIDARTDGAREVVCPTLAQAIRACAKAIATQLPQRWKELSGVGLAAQGGSGCLFDREDGKPRTRMQLWNDARAVRIQRDIASRRPAAYWRQLAYLDGPGAGLARLTWLREQHPGAWNEVALYGGVGEYLFHRLTGLWRQDVGNALQIGCYNVRSRAIDSEPLSLVEAKTANVAPLRDGHETHPLSEDGAKLLGARPGIPVAGPYMDHEAGFLSGVASLGTGVLQCSLGTAWVGNFLQRKLPPPEKGLNLVLPAPVEQGRLIVRVLTAGNTTWDWVCEVFTGSRGVLGRKRVETILADRLIPPPGLVGLPWLTRANPFTDAGGSGGVLGIGTHTRREDLVRAFVAGLCFGFRHVLEPVLRTRPARTVLLTGGASRSPGVRKLLAVLMHPLPVCRSLNDELAGAGGSVWAFQPRAAARPTRPVDAPVAHSVGEIQKAYEQFRATCQGLASGLGPSAGSQLAHFQKSP